MASWAHKTLWNKVHCNYFPRLQVRFIPIFSLEYVAFARSKTLLCTTAICDTESITARVPRERPGMEVVIYWMRDGATIQCKYSPASRKRGVAPVDHPSRFSRPLCEHWPMHWVPWTRATVAGSPNPVRPSDFRPPSTRTPASTKLHWGEMAIKWKVFTRRL